MRRAGHVARMKEMRNAYSILVGRHEKRVFGRSRHRWENIKMHLRKNEWEGVNWIHLAHDTNQ